MHYGTIIQTGWRGFSRNALVLVGFAILYTIVAAVVSFGAQAVAVKLIEPGPHVLQFIAYGLLLLLEVVVHLVGGMPEAAANVAENLHRPPVVVSPTPAATS